MRLSDTDRKKVISWLKQYINDHCIYRVRPGEDNLPPLHPSHAPDGYRWMILSNKGLLDGTFANYIALSFWDIFAVKYKQKPFQLCGREGASIPLLVALSMVAPTFGIHNINSFYMRKEPKEYGTKQEYEGIMRNDLPALFVDDFYNSRSSLLTTKKFVEQNNVEFYSDAFTIINKQWELYDNVPDAFRLNTRKAAEGINIISLFNITDFDLRYSKYMLNKFDQELAASEVNNEFTR